MAEPIKVKTPLGIILVREDGGNVWIDLRLPDAVESFFAASNHGLRKLP